VQRYSFLFNYTILSAHLFTDFFNEWLPRLIIYGMHVEKSYLCELIE
jgi:hypothetical protein